MKTASNLTFQLLKLQITFEQLLLCFKQRNSPQVFFIYVYLQFKSEFKENYLALTSLKIPLSHNKSRCTFNMF